MMPVSWFRRTWFKIAASYAALFLLAALTIFGAAYVYAGSEMRATMDASISQDIQGLLAEYADKGIPALKEAVEERIAESPGVERVYLLVDSSGETVAGNIKSLPLGFGSFEGPLTADAAVKTEPSGDPYYRGEARQIKDGVLFVGRDARQLEEILEIILGTFSLGMAGTTIAAMAIGSFLGRRSARRIETISQTAHAIVTRDLSRRIPVRADGDELDLLSHDINVMLDRIQNLMEGIRQISSDIAHDLRMPVTRLKDQIEAAARGKVRSSAAQKSEFTRMTAEADGIIDTFNSLLRIAQIEGGARKSNFKVTDLSDVLFDLREIYEPVAETSRHGFTADIELGVRVKGDRELLVQLFANLIENALRHVPGGGKVHLKLCQHSGTAEVVVADNGPGIPVEEHPKVFRRLYRMERSRTSAGTGLGLSLVAAIADLHGAKIRLNDNRPGLEVAVRFSTIECNPMEMA